MCRSSFLFRSRLWPATSLRPVVARRCIPVPQHHVTGVPRRHVYSQLASAASVGEQKRGGGLYESMPPECRSDSSTHASGASSPGSATRGPPRARTRAEVGPVFGVRDHPRVISVKFQGLLDEVPLSKLWLRDSCKCASCVDPSSGQKNFETCDIQSPLQVREVTASDDGTSIEVQWADDAVTGEAVHKSVYPLSVLHKSVVAPSPRVDISHTPWDRKAFESRVRFVPYAEWVKGGEEFWRAFYDLAQLGLAFIKDVPESETAVEEIANTIGHIQTTFYGKTWDVVSKPQAENVAYTNVYLGLHQDLLYMKDPPRLQLLHCLANTCEGGESLFSDGVRAAEEVRRRDPEHFRLLRDHQVHYHYDKNGHWYECHRPVLSVGRDGWDDNTVRSIGWAPPFQDDFPPPNAARLAATGSDPLEHWRAAAREFRDVLCEPENLLEYKMKAGECVVFDNMRVLHGRRQFDLGSGKRWLKGTYIQEQVMMSKLAQMPREVRRTLP